MAQLRAETAHKVTAANFDFQQRLNEVRDSEAAEKQRRKEEKKRKREEKREEEALGRIGVVKRAKATDDEPGSGQRRAGEEPDVDVDQVQREHDDMAAMMGFGGFGGKKRR